jgi:SAM-dependent methyltransferase
MNVVDARPAPLDNHRGETGAYHAALAALYDTFSFHRTIDLVELLNTRCLEVGAGGGGFARLLAEEVGPDGKVLATDLNPGRIPLHRNLSVVEHDITSDLVTDTFDFIHARLVLAHLPGREQILHRLVQALTPGGTILIEDWDSSHTDMVLHAPSLEAAELYTRYQETLNHTVIVPGGTDPAWARRIHAAMLHEGLSDVQTVMHAQAWIGGDPGCQLLKATLAQVWDRLLPAGLSDDALTQVRALLDDSRLVLAGHPLYSTSGRRLASTVECAA